MFRRWLWARNQLQISTSNWRVFSLEKSSKKFLLKPSFCSGNRVLLAPQIQCVCWSTAVHLQIQFHSFSCNLTHLLNSFELDLVMSLLIYWHLLNTIFESVSDAFVLFTLQSDTGKWFIRNESFELISATDSSNWFQQLIPVNEVVKWVRQMNLATVFSAL